MSFNARLGMSNTQRRRSSDNRLRTARQPPQREDAQPNESLDLKRPPRVLPPQVFTSIPPRNTWKGAGKNKPATGATLSSLQSQPSSETLITGSLSAFPSPRTMPSTMASQYSHSMLHRDISVTSANVSSGLERSKPSGSGNRFDNQSSIVNDPPFAVQRAQLSGPRPSKRLKLDHSDDRHLVPLPNTTRAAAAVDVNISLSDEAVRHFGPLPQPHTADSSLSGLDRDKSSPSLDFPMSTFRPVLLPEFAPRTTGAPVSLPAGPSTSREPIKRERSPSPVLNHGPRLVTEGVIRIAPLPPDCMSTRAGHKQARSRLAATEVMKLKDLGLHPQRALFRDDGMVIDWKSDVPVMSDTLRPPPAGTAAADVAAIPEPNSPAKRRKKRKVVLDFEPDLSVSSPQRSVAIEGEQEFRRNSKPGMGPISPRPGSHSENPVAQVKMEDRQSSGPPHLPNLSQKPHPHPTRTLHPPTDVIDLTDDCDDDVSESQPPNPPPTSSRCEAPFGDTRTQNTHPAVSVAVTYVTSAAQEDASCSASLASSTVPEPTQAAAAARPTSPDTAAADAALDFLQRYMVVFLSDDRAVLAQAYSHCALFSVQTIAPPPSTSSSSHRPLQPTHPPPPHRGRAAILGAILALPMPTELSDAEGDAEGGEGEGGATLEVAYDVVRLPGSGDILLVCYGARDEPKETGKGKGKAGGRQRGDIRDAATGSGGVEGEVRRAYDQRFVLRRRDRDEEDRNTSGLWPLVAVSHQMTIRPLS